MEEAYFMYLLGVKIPLIEEIVQVGCKCVKQLRIQYISVLLIILELLDSDTFFIV